MDRVFSMIGFRIKAATRAAMPAAGEKQREVRRDGLDFLQRAGTLAAN
jgi:hypothetical protein